MKVMLLAMFAALGCSPAPSTGISAMTAQASPDPSGLTDEFATTGKPKGWKMVHQTENLGNDPILNFEVKDPGWLTLMPRTSTWYRDYRGALAYKEVTGDFTVTTHLRVSGRSGNRPPQSQFSLAGLMVRTPRAVNRSNWRPGQENYMFLSIGSADRAGTWQHEVKTTINSDSQLRTWPTNGGEAVLRITRRGAEFTMATQEGNGWRVHERYRRPDMPATVQVGLCCYTDWPGASALSAEAHNATTIQGGNPDLVALVDYVRFEK